MHHFYFWRYIVLSSLLTMSAVGRLAAQAPAKPAAASLPACVLKGGLRLTHLSFSRSTTAWQAIMPASLALEYRLGSRYSLYTQLDTDVHLNSAAPSRRGRRSAMSTTLPTVALGLGGRYYYSRPAASQARATTEAPEFGRYLALEAGTELTQAATSQPTSRSRLAAGRSRVSLASPFLFARWGVQNRLRPHVLYDLNAGLGVVAAPPTAEYLGTSRRLDVAAQVNISVYLAN